MKIYITRYINLYLIILVSFTIKVDACTEPKLGKNNLICGLNNGAKNIKEAPKGCTILAITTFSPDQVDDVRSINTDNLPIMMIDDSITYEQWTKVVNEDIQLYMKKIVKLDIDIIGFDFMYNPEATVFDSTFSTNLKNFINKLRKCYPKMSFGLLLIDDMNIIFKSLDPEILKDIFDLIIVKYKIYHSCKYQQHQGEMAFMQTANDIDSIFKTFTKVGTCTKKLFISLSLNVVSFKDDSDEAEDMSFSYLCTNKMSVKRKFCMENLENLFQKARRCANSNLGGIFLVDTDNDDIDGSCDCELLNNAKKFPAITVLSKAMTENAYTIDNFKCENDVIFPIIHRP